jgi:hypothetical protein
MPMPKNRKNDAVRSIIALAIMALFAVALGWLCGWMHPFTWQMPIIALVGIIIILIKELL